MMNMKKKMIHRIVAIIASGADPEFARCLLYRARSSKSMIILLYGFWCSFMLLKFREACACCAADWIRHCWFVHIGSVYILREPLVNVKHHHGIILI